MSTFGRYNADGGQGNANGPGSSVAGGIAVFADTSGENLAQADVTITETLATITIAPLVNKGIVYTGYVNTDAGTVSGGNISLLGGDATTGAESAGGTVTIRGGSSNRSGAAAGITITGGNNSGTGIGGTVTIAGGTCSGSGNAGALVLKGGRGTSGIPGNITLRTGNSAQGTTWVQVDYQGNIAIGNAMLGSMATNGFLSIPNINGTPGGTPTSFTGSTPSAFDTFDNIMWHYNTRWISTPKQVLAEAPLTSGASIDLSYLSAKSITLSLSANCTATVSNMKSGEECVLRVTQVGGFTLALTAVKWPGGAAPTFSAGAGAIDIVRLYSDGTNVYANITQNYS